MRYLQEIRSTKTSCIKMIIKAFKDAFLFPSIVNLPVSHTGDTGSVCPGYSVVHVLATLRNT